MNSSVNRRWVMAGISAATFAAFASPSFAFSNGQAENLIGKLVGDINKIINSGKSESAMLKDFDRTFGKYADVNRIGQLVLGADGRSASASQKQAFARTFQGYIARKYGRRFREFVGGRVEVNGSRAIKSYYEVTTTAHLKGEAPFVVQFVVADKTGLFIDMKIEGISLIKAERTEIGAMLDKRKGNLDQLIADLKKAG
jgi:phospholipid transport system substrate-binding protein